jgi:hypothetical protein
VPSAAELMLRPGHVLRRIQRGALLVGMVAGALCLLGALASPDQFLRSYLVAYLFFTGIALGCLAILMIQHITGGAWGAVIRRELESATRTLPLMMLLFLPLAAGLRELYVWARPEVVGQDVLLQRKAVYLSPGFFYLRAALYFAAWIIVARALNRWSVEQDRTGGALPGQRLELLSRGGLALLGITMTFASIDWMMSLEPHWFSTIYGIIFMGGSVLSAFAFVIVMLALAADGEPLAAVITPRALNDLGNLLLAFVMLWAYFSFSQFLIIWAGNLPEEIPWYIARLRGGWQWVALGLVTCHFALPFLVLLPRAVKRRAPVLGAVALGLLVVRFVDLFWVVTPAFRPANLAIHWLDPTAALAVGGFWLATFVWQLGERPLVPLHDESLPLDT